MTPFKMALKTRYLEIEPYTTKDGSIIRELMHPDQHGNRNQSFAEASISSGCETISHKHIHSEEIYYIIEGKGWMTLGEDQFEIEPGDTICIPPGTSHKVKNTGNETIRILCCCSPPYAHEDTIVMEED